MPTFIEYMLLGSTAVGLAWAFWVTGVLGGNASEMFCLTLRLNRAERELKVLREDYKHQYRMGDADWEQEVKDINDGGDR